MSQAATTRTLDGLELPAEGSWVIDPSHSSVSFTARHLMVSKVRGNFGTFTGRLNIDDVPERSSAEVTIDARSINTNDAKRDEHLRSADFLDAETYPTLRFRTNGLERTGSTSFKLQGELAIKDVTRPVTLDVNYEGTVTDPWGNTKVGFSASTEIDREEFGITWNAALETGGVLVGKIVRIELEIEAAHA